MDNNYIHTLTSDMAVQIMREAIAVLNSRKQVASISVCNAQLFEIAKCAMDGVSLTTITIAELKATQAAYTGETTRATRDQIASGDITPEILGLDPRTTLKWAGGVPIYNSTGHLLGGLGISNLKEDEDEEVAVTVIKKFGFVCAN